VTRLRKTLAALWKTLLGGVFCQFPLTALLVIGWTYRAMQRRALHRWAGLAPLPVAEAIAARDALLAERRLGAWPNWVLGPRGVGSLVANARVGLLAILNTWVVTLFPASLLALGWYAGWDNSFNKGYEQHTHGIVLSLIGIALFLPVLALLPFAQARQAITGDVRAFYDLRVVYRVATRRPLHALGVAVVYGFVSLPISILIVMPLFFDRIVPSTLEMSDAELLAFLNRYYFRLSVFGFLAYVGVRLLATRMYCDAIVSALRSRALTSEALHPMEQAALDRLGLIPTDDTVSRSHPVVRATRPVWRATAIAALLVVWFGFVAQIYIREFLVYHPIRGWLNQPLIQVPWFRYVPAALQDAAREPSPRR